MKIFREHIVVKVPSIFIDESRYKGVDGRTIIVDVLHRPEHHVRHYGVVVSVPDELSRFPIAQDHIGAPAYHDSDLSYRTWKTTEDIQMDVMPGDKIYFHYNCLLPDMMGKSMWNHLFLFSKKEKENGKDVTYHYFRVKYDLVFAAIRYEKTCPSMDDFQWWMEPLLQKTSVARVPDQDDDTIEQGTFYVHEHNTYRKLTVPMNSYVLVEPDMESWEDISIPTPLVIDGKQILNADGSKKMKPKEQWMVVKAMPGEKYLRGWVRHTGAPLKGDREFLKAGMYVYFQRFTNTPVTIEGVDYFRMMQRHIFQIDHTKSESHAEVSTTV